MHESPKIRMLHKRKKKSYKKNLNYDAFTPTKLFTSVATHLRQHEMKAPFVSQKTTSRKMFFEIFDIHFTKNKLVMENIFYQ